MTMPNHMAQSALIQCYICPNIYAIILAAFLGGLWDYFHLQDQKDDWTVYNIAHEPRWWKFLIPYANLHLIEDLLTHNKEGGMNKFYKPLEVILWIAIMFFFVYMIIPTLKPH